MNQIMQCSVTINSLIFQIWDKTFFKKSRGCYWRCGSFMSGSRINKGRRSRSSNLSSSPKAIQLSSIISPYFFLPWILSYSRTLDSVTWWYSHNPWPLLSAFSELKQILAETAEPITMFYHHYTWEYRIDLFPPLFWEDLQRDSVWNPLNWSVDEEENIYPRSFFSNQQ